MSTSLMVIDQRWVRSQGGYVAGVCQGLGERFGIAPGLLRLIWAVAVLACGVGAALYLILWYALPREDKVAAAEHRRFLGVCVRLSRITGLEVGLVRTLALLSALASAGLTILAYFVLYFVLPDERTPVTAVSSRPSGS